MASDAVEWSDFEAADEELARLVSARFASHRHGLMATIRSDGSPRLSGMEVPIRSGHLWLAMTPGSRKANDLNRDPRFALHSAPDSERLPHGDARVDGVVRVADSHERQAFIKGHRHPIDDPTIMELFVAQINRAVVVRVQGNTLLIECWTPGSGRTTHKQR